MDALRPEFDFLYRYWLDACAGRAMPARADIDPLALKPVLGKLSILERSGDTFRYRLCGTAQAKLLGQEMSGKPIDEIWHSQVREQLRSQLEQLCRERRPGHHVQHIDQDRVRRAYERLLLPLSGDGVIVDQAIVSTLSVEPGIEHAWQWAPGFKGGTAP